MARIGYHPEPYWWNYLIRFSFVQVLLKHYNPFSDLDHFDF